MTLSDLAGQIAPSFIVGIALVWFGRLNSARDALPKLSERVALLEQDVRTTKELLKGLTEELGEIRDKMARRDDLEKVADQLESVLNALYRTRRDPD